jgi:hypothetical protein
LHTIISLALFSLPLALLRTVVIILGPTWITEANLPTVKSAA